ncbi:MAG TPA: hypothetical protein VFZ09_43650 [Archangium sp.]|uniref:hypothetical protein n=1 Tax=Archangium sp. TaxID=1872627 RepID=UPI002E379081|nr:hypothetical protein [Archangium sp.]HEX5753176.1 hypothetical protein [Archangium sp.]
MKKLMPLFALAATACGHQVLERELKDLPSLRLSVTPVAIPSKNMWSVLNYTWSFGEDCFRIPAATRLTINGEAATVENLGTTHLGIDGSYRCKNPTFESPPRPADEPRTEFALSDGSSNLRAVFLGLRAPRYSLVNGQEQATVRSGAEIDIQWFPATDLLEKVDVFVMKDGASTHWIQNPQVQGNHIRLTLPALESGNYVLRVNSKGSAGVEACEGFNSCHAGFDERSLVPVVVE